MTAYRALNKIVNTFEATVPSFTCTSSVLEMVIKVMWERDCFNILNFSFASLCTMCTEVWKSALFDLYVNQTNLCYLSSIS